MSSKSSVVTVRCLPFRECLSFANIKSKLRGFVYEYETPKIVTIHSVSIALMCRLIQLLILIYGIVYLMIHKKGYQDTDTSIISSVTLKVKGIGCNRAAGNRTLVLDVADYIVPPQENNALFLMTNFIRTDQEHKRCPESPNEKMAICTDDRHCLLNRNFLKASGRWTGRCLIINDSSVNNSQPKTGRCELEGWCPVENDHYIPAPMRDALNFTIFIKNFIEFPRFNVIRKNIEASASYLKRCNYDPVMHKTCPIFRVGTLLDIIEPSQYEQMHMLKTGGVIRVKIHWNCDLDKKLAYCKPEYSFGRLDSPYREKSFSYGFNFRFASHWKYRNQSYRTLTKAFGLRFIISVSGLAGRFDPITLTLNIGSLIGILGLATFICDIVALYVHRQSDVYRRQKFQNVNLSLSQLGSINHVPLNAKRQETDKEIKRIKHDEQTIENPYTTDNNEEFENVETSCKDNFRRVKTSAYTFYDGVSGTSKDTNPQLTPLFIFGSDHQRGLSSNSFNDSPSLSSIKQRFATTAHPTQLEYMLNEEKFYDKANIAFVDEDTSELNERYESKNSTNETNHLNKNSSPTHGESNGLAAKLETFL